MQEEAMLGHSRSKAVNLGDGGWCGKFKRFPPITCQRYVATRGFCQNSPSTTADWQGVYTQQMPSAPWCGDNGYALLCKINCASYKKLLVDAVANGEAVTTFSTTTCEDLAAISSFHTVTETMLVSFLTVWRLECSFHLYLNLFICLE